MPLIYLLLITEVTFGTFVASVVKTGRNNSISRTFLNSRLGYETLLKIVVSVNLESSCVQNILVT